MKVCSVCQRCYEDNVLSCIEQNHHSFSDDRPGNREIISGIRLDFLVKSDATGKTYKATNVDLNQNCSVKIITGVSATDRPELTRQFLNEAQLVVSLNHPNLVQIYQAGILENNEFYVITEEIEGQTLRDFLDNGISRSEITSVQIARQIAEGLETIHLTGLAHRNINPENIILTSDLEHRLLVKIKNIDFGGINQQITAFGVSNSEHRLNNLKYFSPEQCEGQTPDFQTDIYSLGVVLYEMLAGKPPFDAPDADGLIHKQIKMPPPEVKILNFDIRALLTYTLMDSLQKIPRLRLKKATAFARQLRHIEQLATHLILPPPATSPAHSAKKAVVQPKTEHTEPPIINKPIEIIEKPVLGVPETVAAVSLVTNKLPPLPLAGFEEIAVEKKAIQPERVVVAENGINNIPTPPKPLMVEWEQPEDIPLEPEMTETSRQEFSDSEFYPAEDIVEKESSFSAYDKPSAVVEAETSREQSEEVPVLLDDEEPRSAYFPMLNQLPIIGAGLVLVIFLVIVSTLVNVRSESGSSEQTVTKAPPTEKVLPKPETSRVISTENIDVAEETEEPEEPEELDSKERTPIKNESGSTDSKISEVKKRTNSPASTVKQTVKTQTVKELSDNKLKQNDLKSEERKSDKVLTKPKVALDKRGNVKPSQSSTKADAFTRPRIVKNTRQ